MNKAFKLFFFLFILFTGTNACATTVSFEYYQRLIYLKVKVNNTDSLLFLFDTGANASAIDKQTAERLKLETVRTDSVEGSAGTLLMPFVQTRMVAIGRSAVRNIQMSKYDLSTSLAPPGKRLDGILGTDFLKHFVVSIDFQNKTFSLFKKIKERPENPIPFDFNNNIPSIRATINDSISTSFRYDSGASLFETSDIYINTTEAVFNMLFAHDTTLRPHQYFSASGVGGNIRLPVYQVHSVSFSKTTLREPFLIIQPRQGYFARPDAVGFFGNNLVEKSGKVTIDFLSKQLYLWQKQLVN